MIEDVSSLTKMLFDTLTYMTEQDKLTWEKLTVSKCAYLFEAHHGNAKIRIMCDDPTESYKLTVEDRIERTEPRKSYENSTWTTQLAKLYTVVSERVAYLELKEQAIVLHHFLEILEKADD